MMATKEAGLARKRRKSTTPLGSEAPAMELPELPERWSAGWKTYLVLRLLGG